MSDHLADYIYLKANQVFEQQCHEQAKREIGLTPNSGMDQIHKVLKRAQEIKREKLAAERKQVMSVNEVLDKAAKYGD